MPLAYPEGDLSKTMGDSLFRALRSPEYITFWTYSLLRTTPPVWNLLNKAGKTLYEEHRPNLDELQQKVLTGLVENGIALVHLDDIFPDASLIADLREHFELHEGKAKAGSKKTFLRYLSADILNGEVPIIDLDNPFIRLSLNPRILNIVNSYIGICSKLIYFELAMTNLMSAGAAPMGSQRWHRDPGMKRIVKMFIYLTEVDEETGPFAYVLGSHAGGQWRRLFAQKQFGRRGIYPPEGVVDKVVPKSDIRVCTGRAGTVIFCDTTGLHRGGYSVSKSRVMYTSVYVAEGDVIKRKFRYPEDFDVRIKALGPTSRFAVT